MFPKLATLFTILYLLSGCRRACFFEQLQLEGGTLSISPPEDSVAVGDTILLAYVFPTQYSINGGSSEADFSQAENVANSINIATIPEKGVILWARDSFDIFAIRE